MDKRILLAMLFGILLIANVHAYEFDNVKGEYEKSTHEITIWNGLGFGSKIATIKLETPSINYVPIGDNVEIAELTFNTFDDYNNALQDMTFYNIKKNNLEITKQFTYKIKTIHTGYRPTYESQCSIVNSNVSFNRCLDVHNGTEKFEYNTWADLNTNNMDSGIITLGIFTDVKEGDYIEWIPRYFGRQISEWAIFAADTDLRGYYNMNENTGIAVNDAQGLFNGTVKTITNGIQTWVPGKIGLSAIKLSNNAIGSDVAATYINITSPTEFAATRFIWNFSVGGWVNITQNVSCQSVGTDSSTGCVLAGQSSGSPDSNEKFYMFASHGSAGGAQYEFTASASSFTTQTTASCKAHGDAKWHFIVGVTNVTHVALFVDGVLCNTAANPAGTYAVTNSHTVIASRTYPATQRPFNGSMDAVFLYNRTLSAADITALYNAGLGLEYPFVAGVNGVTITSPANNSNFTTLGSVLFNATASIGNLGTAVNSTLYLYGGGGLSTTFTDSVPNNKSNFSIGGLAPDGVYNFSIQMCGNDGSCLFSTNFTFTIDGLAPAITITYPTTFVKYHVLNNNLTLNWSFTELNPGVCSFNYGNATVNTSIGCFLNSTSFNVTNNKRNVMFFANDSIGNFNQAYKGWSYYILENYRNLSINTSELATETYSINVSFNDTVHSSIVGTLVYNNTNYTTTRTGDSPTLQFSTTIAIPQTPVMFGRLVYWIFTLANTTTTEQITTFASNQTVTKFSIDNCSINTIMILNYTIKDEDGQQILVPPVTNTTIDANVLISSIADSSLVTNYSASINNTNPLRICIPNILGSGTSYRLDATVGYTSLNRVYEYNNIQNFTLSLSNASLNISLLDLLTTRSQIFSIIYRDANVLTVPGVLISINRNYIGEGLFKTVEAPVTDFDGKTSAHLVLNDVIYTFVVSKDGRILATFSNVIAQCQNPTLETCTLNLQDSSPGLVPTNPQNDNGATFNITWDKALRRATAVFATLNGSTANFTFTVGNLTFPNGLCYQSIIASSSNLVCNVPASFGNNTIIAKLYKDGNFLGQSLIDIKDLSSSIFGNTRALLAVGMILMLVGMALSSGAPVVLIFAAIGLFFAGAMNLLDNNILFGTGSTILWFIIAALVLIFKYNMRER